MQNEQIAKYDNKIDALEKSIALLTHQLALIRTSVSQQSDTYDQSMKHIKELEKYSDTLGFFKRKEQKYIYKEKLPELRKKTSELYAELAKTKNESSAFEKRIREENHELQQIQQERDKYMKMLHKAEEDRCRREAAAAWEVAEKRRIAEEKRKKEEALRESASRGDAKAQYELSTLYYDDKVFDQYVFWLNQAAENGYETAQYQLGLVYLKGVYSVSKDYIKAMEWLEKAAENGNSDAQFELARLYYYGDTCVQADIQKSLYWLNKTGDQNIRASALRVRLLNNGDIQKDPFEMFQFYENILARHKIPLAMIAQGEMYCLGQGTRPNPIKGKNYIEEGMKHIRESLSPSFCLRLGMLYYNGKTNENGFSDIKNALPYLEKAAVVGDYRIIALVKEIKDETRKKELGANLRNAERDLEWHIKQSCDSCKNKSVEVSRTTQGTVVGTRYKCNHGYNSYESYDSSTRVYYPVLMSIIDKIAAQNSLMLFIQ